MIDLRFEYWTPFVRFYPCLDTFCFGKCSMVNAERLRQKLLAIFVLRFKSFFPRLWGSVEPVLIFREIRRNGLKY